jgi:hypothetical protein
MHRGYRTNVLSSEQVQRGLLTSEILTKQPELRPLPQCPEAAALRVSFLMDQALTLTYVQTDLLLSFCQCIRPLHHQSEARIDLQPGYGCMLASRRLGLLRLGASNKTDHAQQTCRGENAWKSEHGRYFEILANHM